ncbi:MAG TPA: hypothetical protein VLG25_00015 [Patescibacteria group bacterium]|nr:hypothetical protein [Patescibacteria group bacterium]
MVSRFTSNERQRKHGEAHKTPLNFYRSTTKSNSDSPFEKKLKQSKSRVLFSKTVDLLLIVLAFFALGYILIIRPQPKVDIDSVTYHPLNYYSDFLSAEFKDIKNRNKITFDEGQIVAEAKKHFPEISDAAITLNLFSQTPNVKISVSEPAFILSSQEADYIVDHEGVAVAKRVELPKLSALPILLDQTGFNVSLGKQVISSDQVKFINQLIAQAKKSKVPILSMTLPAKAQELDLKTKDHSYYIKFFLGGDSLAQIGQFLAARHQFEQTGKQPTKYLDVRVSGKIYYQ